MQALGWALWEEVLWKDGRIVKVGLIEESQAQNVLDAQGLVVAPGGEEGVEGEEEDVEVAIDPSQDV